ncbi:FtsX-like permease family protein [Hymenobacter nivis]|nr:FtsX-like permease family protein [Hymenobacter nivis]
MLPHLLYALRMLRQHPAYTALNVGGLVLALACSLLLYWFVRFHQSFDTYQPQAARICRLVTEQRYGGIAYNAGIPTPVGPALRREVPWLRAVAMSIGQADQYVRVLGVAGQLEATYAEDKAVAFVEPAYFSILAYHWQVGTAARALRRPFTAVLTRRLAHRYFGAANPLGRCLRLNNSLEVQVTGVLGDLPPNTDQPYELFISYATLRYYQHAGTPLTSWEQVSSQTHAWVLLPPGGTPAQLEKALMALHRAHFPATLGNQRYRVLPLLAQHFSASYNEGRYIDRATLQVLILIGALLVLTAGVNFVNLATAQALGRGREIGVRRTVGATSRRIFWQFMTETLLLVLAAAGAGLVLAYAGLPGLRGWTDAPVPLQLDGAAWLFLAGLVTLVTLGAGWYPGRVLAGFRPAQVLKGQAPTLAAGGLWVRRGLIVAQLALSQGFVLAVLVMFQQLTVWLTADPGFASRDRVLLPARPLRPAVFRQLRQELSQVPGVLDLSFCSDVPALSTINTSPFAYDHRAAREPFLLARLPADAQYVPLFGLQLVGGHNLPASDTVRGYLLNETAVRHLGVGSPQAVIGHHLSLENGDESSAGPILGVVRDWRYQGFQNESVSLVLYTNRTEYRALTLHLAPSMGGTPPPAVRAIWHRYYPNQLFSSTRLADVLAGFYDRERQQLAIVRLAALTAIAVGCLGLYGLIAFLAQRRAREIGIRKIFGARPWQIIASFVGEFAGLLVAAFLVAAPLAGWLMQRWLVQFDTHISLSPWLFGATLAGTAALTLLTIGYLTLRAALAPPAPALRAK